MSASPENTSTTVEADGAGSLAGELFAPGVGGS
jgi:hypothetical protein